MLLRKLQKECYAAWDFLFRQSRISAKNIRQLTELAQTEDQVVSRFAAVVLELAHLRPYRRRRFRGLKESHPKLWERMAELSIIDDFGLGHHEEG